MVALYGDFPSFGSGLLWSWLASAAMELLKGGAVCGAVADLAGTVALITGSTSGIGMHVALGCVSRPERDWSNGGPPLPRAAKE